MSFPPVKSLDRNVGSPLQITTLDHKFGQTPFVESAAFHPYAPSRLVRPARRLLAERKHICPKHRFACLPLRPKEPDGKTTRPLTQAVHSWTHEHLLFPQQLMRVSSRPSRGSEHAPRIQSGTRAPPHGGLARYPYIPVPIPLVTPSSSAKPSDRALSRYGYHTTTPTRCAASSGRCFPAPSQDLELVTDSRLRYWAARVPLSAPSRQPSLAESGSDHNVRIRYPCIVSKVTRHQGRFQALSGLFLVPIIQAFPQPSPHTL